MSNNRTFFKQVKEGHMSLKDIFSDVLKKHTPEESARVLISGTPLTTPRESEMLAAWQKPFMFFRFLVGCIVVIIMAYALSWLGYPLGNDLILVMLSFLAPVTMLLLAWEMHIPRDISLTEVLTMVAVGGALSLVINAVFSMAQMILEVYVEFSMQGAAWAPVVEEPAKLAVIYLILKRKNRKYILSGMLIGMAVGTGFAIIETLNYIMNYMREAMALGMALDMYENGYSAATMVVALADNNTRFSYVYDIFVNFGYSMGLNVAVARALGSFSSHGAYAAIYGGALMIAKGSHRIEPKHLLHVEHIKYFAAACILHAMNNSNIPAYIQILLRGFEYGWAILETLIMFGLFFLPLMRRGVNQVVDLCAAHNGGRVTMAVNRGVAGAGGGAVGGHGGYAGTAPVQGGVGAVQLECIAGPNMGQVYRCQEGKSLSFGRTAGRCDIALPGCSNVSSLHCAVSVSGGRVTVTDLGSTNGTFLGQQRLVPNQSMPVSNGAVIYLGNQNCAFRVNIR